MRTLLLAVVGSLICASSAAARQAADIPPAPMRGDVHVVIGWQNLRMDPSEDGFGPNDNWSNSILFGGAGAGWYWTEHLKTQVDFGGGTEAEHYRYRQLTLNGQQASEISQVHVQQQSLAISQQYQFFRNQWFHPHLGAGVDIGRETRTARYEPIFAFDPALRITRQIAPARVEPSRTRTVVRPFVQTGFKAYMTRRAFFTSDVRLMARGGIDEVLFRFGFGIDF